MSDTIDPEEIAGLPIDPGAEPVHVRRGNGVSARAEEDFFKQGGENYKLAHNQQNLGLIGKLFGSNSSAPTNIAGFVILCSFAILLVSLFFPGNPDLVESRKWLIGLITSAMSFIFGAASSDKK